MEARNLEKARLAKVSWKRLDLQDSVQSVNNYSCSTRIEG